MTLHEWLLLALTSAMTVSVALQAKFTRDTAKVAKEAERREREREKPRIELVAYSYGSHYTDASGKVERTEFFGFSIRNASKFDIVISNWSLEVGIPIDEPHVFESHRHLNPARTHRGQQISDPDTPRRLQYGEAMKVVFHQEEVLLNLRCDDDTIARVRPQCQDSLGNTYKLSHWMEWDVERRVSAAHDTPGDGYVTSEERRAERETRHGKSKRRPRLR